ncbi:acyl-CoA dehydrogenase [Enemella dayhoffiae]|uniref:Acyl-CoA dehydrogenase n=1 Tax=Enemella dayhoffiae TaxID=2016507 RepID=A0A255H0I2_9ACTN|nr:acyl-CoA dehydrogenase [Enemella dayhoffiae]
MAEQVRSLLPEANEVPLPGSGRTAERWAWLTRMTKTDVVLGRMLEAHVDARAILTELQSTLEGPEQWWGVWAAEAPTAIVLAEPVGDGGFRVRGTKAWCSGAGLCTHALVTVRAADNPERRLLVAVDLGHPGVRPRTGSWTNAGMARSATSSVDFDAVPATLVGDGDDYLERAGFWHGGAGVAACWLGGALAVADAFGRSARRDPHTLAHRGAVDAALSGAEWAMTAAAAELEADPTDLPAARIRALRLRAIVESAAALTLDRVGRALGPGPLTQDQQHTTAVADLTVYVRQSHAERDLAALAGLLP